MEAEKNTVKITSKQARVLKLLFKFRFVNAQSLAQVIGVDRRAVHYVLEALVSAGFVKKVYRASYRIDRRPAYYHLTKPGVTAVRNLLEIKESAVNTLYKDENASDSFIAHCQVVLACYAALKNNLPPDTDIFTKTEINRFSQFPKNRPDLYIRTPSGSQAIVVVANDSPPYIIHKRLDEIITHSEDEGWDDGDYPVIAFVLKDTAAKNSFLFKTNKKLEGMGMDEDEITILATSLEALLSSKRTIWHNAFYPIKPVPLL